MQGDAIKEMATRFREPKEIGQFIARPSDWTVEDKASLIKPGPLATAVAVSTLLSLSDYVGTNRDKLAIDTLSAHVVSPTEARIFAPLANPARSREVFVIAKADNLMEAFAGRFMEIEDFILGLQVRFEATDDRARVLTLLGTVKSEVVKTSTDDGMTQMVEARAGAVLKTETAVPNPVTLRPFRTFREVEQPESKFVLRVKQTGALPQVGIFEADGGAWKIDAIGKITRWLRTSLPADLAVLG